MVATIWSQKLTSSGHSRRGQEGCVERRRAAGEAQERRTTKKGPAYRELSTFSPSFRVSWDILSLFKSFDHLFSPFLGRCTKNPLSILPFTPFCGTLTTPPNVMFIEVPPCPILSSFAPEIPFPSYFFCKKGTLLCSPIRDTVLAEDLLHRFGKFTPHSFRMSLYVSYVAFGIFRQM